MTTDLRGDGPIGRPAFRLGAASFLAIYFVLLFAIPADLIVPGMGAGGTPASLIALIGFVWWIAATLIPGQKRFRISNPVRTALGFYLAFTMLSWMIGKMRPLTPLESTTSDRALITMAGLAGIALVTMDGLESKAQIQRVIRWVIGCSMVMVIVGLIQFFFRYDLTAQVQIPGLQRNVPAGGIAQRSIFNRPGGTALHPIEFGVVAAGLVPLAYWRFEAVRTKSSVAMLTLLGLCTMISLSRSAILVLAVAGVIVLVGSSWLRRVEILVCVTVFTVVAGAVVDGLVGTLLSLFENADNDPSIQARLDRFPAVVELVSEYPWLGRGFGTYTPEDYFLLDNEIQKMAIETGLIGVAVSVLFILFVSWMAWRTRGPDHASSLPPTVLAATIVGLFTSMYTFDAFFYRILMGLLYLCIGLVGAWWRLTAAERLTDTSTIQPVPTTTRPQAVPSPA